MTSKVVPVCQSLFGHKFQPRYSYGPSSLGEYEGIGDVARILEATKAKTYIHDVCVRCGHIVHAALGEEER